ncbi:MAG: glycosyltransferase [Caldilineales bacterium]|nr:glycosyltransferase [Caldilineales bacterium]
MKILMAATTAYFPSYGGAGKANRAILEQLVARGHSVRMIAPALTPSAYSTIEAFRSALAKAGVESHLENGLDVFDLNGVEVYAPAAIQELLALYQRQIDEFAPDCILLTSEDWQMGLLEMTLEQYRCPVAILVHGAITLPFGPVAMRPNGWGKTLLQRADAIVAPSRFIRDYIRQHSGLDATVIYLPAYPPLPHPNLASFDSPYVTLINPSAGKGIDIFLEMAGRLPHVEFAAVPTWGTTQNDLDRLSECKNIKILSRTTDINEIWAQSRVLMMPSVWPEAFPLTPVEAMLYGIPVIASNAGGTAEAMLGVDYVLPVQQMKGYNGSVNDSFLPTPLVPPQQSEELQQWEDALRALTESRATWTRQSQFAHKAANDFVAGLNVTPFERLFQEMAESRRARVNGKDATRPISLAGSRAQIAELSPEKRALLQKWLDASTSIKASQRTRTNGDEAGRASFAIAKALTAICSDIFGHDSIDPHRNLFIGSKQALATAELMTETRRALAPKLPLHAVFDHPTIDSLSRFIDNGDPALEPPLTSFTHLLPLRTTGTRPPLFFVSGGGGSENEYMTAYAGLIHMLGQNQPVFGFQGQVNGGVEFPYTSLEEMAARFIAEMRRVQPHGPYFLMGECVGAAAAFEIARQLQHKGERIGTLMFLNGKRLSFARAKTAAQQRQDILKERLRQLRAEPPATRLARLSQMGRNAASVLLPLTANQRMYRAQRTARVNYLSLLLTHRPQPLDIDLLILMTTDFQARGEPQAWQELVGNRLTLRTLAGVHKNYLGAYLAENAAIVEKSLAAAQGR